MIRTLVVIFGVIAFLSVAHGTSAFTTHPVDLSPAASDSPADPAQLSEARRSGYLRGCGFSLLAHHRTTARAAHLSRSQVRYSCPANIGSRLGPWSLVTDDSLGKATPPAANRPRAAGKSAHEPQKS